MCADVNVVDDHCAHPDVCALTNSRGPRDVRAGLNGSKFANLGVVSDEYAAIDKHVPAQAGMGSDDHAPADDSPFAQGTAR